ncbi:Cupin 1 [Dillenia turbinata]|uniref:Germin-like protein n=1 Tax=Dillenia turbinata TaxID=194707 RepID=A0AAN8UHM2_9MAGN
MANTLAFLVLFAVAGISATIAYDPDALQDICVADLNSDSRAKHTGRITGAHRLQAWRAPRGTEMIFVLDGELDVGFITAADVLIAKTIKKGEIFVFPRGLIHFQKNNGEKPASVIAAFNSQLPGAQVVAVSLFASTPPVTDDVLTIAFQIDTQEVETIEAGLKG